MLLATTEEKADANSGSHPAHSHANCEGATSFDTNQEPTNFVVSYEPEVAGKRGSGIRLDFGGPAEGLTRILDRHGNETGFTHRLPGTGHDLVRHDANLDMSSRRGLLGITSTRANMDGRQNLAGMESLGVQVPNPGKKDITIRARFHDVQIGSALSNQLMLFVTDSGGNNIAGGFHLGSGFRGYNLSMTKGDTHSGIDGTGHEHVFDNGDAVVLTLRRRGGKWTLAWNNESDGHPRLTGHTRARRIPWLDGKDLVVGLFYANPRTGETQTSQLDWFSVEVGD
ncbi:MAG: hypothetical protein MI757_12495 [Pirellulales bacterium]|nr:hypothetical protein [Pirellulales bacterium]